jgi:hypothetical protein
MRSVQIAGGYFFGWRSRSQDKSRRCTFGNTQVGSLGAAPCYRWQPDTARVGSGISHSVTGGPLVHPALVWA